MPAPANLVHETSASTGTGDFTVAAVNGKQRFSTAFGTGVTTDVFDYFISNQAAAEWERGAGHMSDANTLVRDTVLESTNSNAAVDFSAGTKDVTNDVPAGNQVAIDAPSQGDIIYADGTKWTSLAASTSGQFLQTQGVGANPAWANAPSVDFQRFNSSDTWTKPTDPAYGPNSLVFIREWAGGTAGVQGIAGTGAAGGPGAGYNERWMLLSELSGTETATVGAGGVTSGAAGGDTTFGSHLTAHHGGSSLGVTGGGGGGALAAGGNGNGTNGGAGGGPNGGAGSISGTTPAGAGDFGGGGGGGDNLAAGDSGWGGGGGGGGATTNLNTAGGKSVKGGGGGGGGSDTGTGSIGGTSIEGGDGGAGATGAAAASAGTQPGGGGGGSESGTFGAGADGRIDVYVFPVA
jgi:hypothetical protein